jgi:transposase
MSANSPYGRRYDREFKDKAVALILGGRSQAEVARDLGVSTCSLWEWVKKAQAGQPATAPATVEAESPAAREMRRLRQEVEYLRQQRDILKKALGILSAEVPPNASR